ncbi:multi antimicrobial extrusion protein MatE [Paenibacillus thermotolerans]|uniref:multi antimicrobial extrusion protein MatE n=1 Tax=Paenibacillus thermotolerans TaxID=3027807 RepID=UPI0023684C2C|nr:MULTISPECIES: multi antimicrobial extrusion protein MatE [unclassified Paenibacillus]
MSAQTIRQTEKLPTGQSRTMATLIAFFLPLGLSSCLVTISHVIINATLSKAAHPELIIASYAIGNSLFLLTERPAVLVRQTCSALVRDRLSFRAMSGVTYILIASTVAFGAVVSYTPVGYFIFRYLYGIGAEKVPAVLEGYRFFMWVSVFSAMRCLYHGVIITHMRTKWLTIGMAVRLLGMFALSQYFIHTNQVNSASVGAIIFASGMCIEMLVSSIEGKSLVRKLPERLERHTVTSKKHIFGFYKPLLYSSFIAVTIQPAVNALLGKTSNIELAVASFAVASSLFNLVMSFFTYIHQIVLNFYSGSPELVRRFQAIVSVIPIALLAVISWTPLETIILSGILGLQGNLLTATAAVLKAYLLLAVVLPWLDFGNGMLMLLRKTNIFVWSQIANASFAIVTLVSLVAAVPHWNGLIGVFAVTAGFTGELSIVWTAIYKQRKQKLNNINIKL